MNTMSLFILHFSLDQVAPWSGDMTIPNLFWRNVEVMSAPPPLYLNFYRKLAMIAKPSIGKGG